MHTAGSTALDMARMYTDNKPGYAEMFAILLLSCCSTCGMTSAGLTAKTPGGEQHLKRCARCPAGGPSAHYCGVECQRADWARHRHEHRRVE